MDMSSEFDSDEGADIINQEMGFTPGSHPRGPDRFVEKLLMGVKGTREKSKAGLKRVMDVDCVAHDIRRGFVQEVKFSSDSRTAREAAGHVDARTNKLYKTMDENLKWIGPLGVC